MDDQQSTISPTNPEEQKGIDSQIIPAVLAKDEIDFAQKIRKVEGVVKWIQIDIMDETLVPFKSFANHEIIRTIINPMEYELHLMVNDPVPIIKDWTEVPNVKRAVIHAEIDKPVELTLKTVKLMGLEVGLAINPETPLVDIEQYIPKIDLLLFLGVTPGQSGQTFQPQVIEKIKEARAKFPDLVISVDGGVKLDNAKQLVTAGANYLCVASGVYGSENPREAIKEFRKLL